jgi:hypothetical protein
MLDPNRSDPNADWPPMIGLVSTTAGRKYDDLG